MGITSKSYTDSLINSIDVSTRSYQTSVSAKSTSELYKNNDKNYTNKNDDFRSILNSKNVSKEKDSAKVDTTNSNQAPNEVKDSDASTDTKDTTNIDELNEKLKTLEDESKSDSKDKITDILEELLNLLAQFGIKEDDLKSNGKINQEFLNTLIEKINKQEGSNNSPNNIMEKIMELLKNDSVKNNLDSNSLKTITNILSNLNSKFTGTDSENAKNIKNLMSEISNMLDNKQNQVNKVLTTEDMLNKNYSQDNSENSTGDDTTASKDNKGLSKEDKFLNSLIDDNKDDSLNKINLFASRVATTQNQGVNAARGLTINKATMIDDLIKDVKFMSTNSLKELTVKVNPGNLGEITIKLVQEDGLMKANLKANSKETTALLSQSLADIKKQLNDQSIKVSDVNIELYQDDTTFFKEQGFGGQFAGENNNQNGSSKGSASTTQSIASEDLIENLAEENNNVNFFA